MSQKKFSVRRLTPSAIGLRFGTHRDRGGVTMQMNLRFIVTPVEGYIPVVIGSKAIIRE